MINYHSAAQLLLYPFGYITDVHADDDAWFKALTGTDGDAAVDPYISQRSSDLYITNGETTDHAYNKYGSMSWTPELDECETAAGGTFCSGGSGFTFPDDEGKVEAVFQKNLDFARNVAATTLDADRPDRPRNATDDATQYQVKASPDIEPNRFAVSYGAGQTLEATTRKILGPVDFVLQVSGPGGNGRTITLRAASWRGGERFGDLRGKYYQRVRTRSRRTSSSRARRRRRVRSWRATWSACASSPARSSSASATAWSPRDRRATRSACWSWRQRTTPGCRPTRRRTTPRRATSTST